MPKFSVIVPVYKVEKYIAQCVESILNQTYKDFEAIFVDDCSPDNSIKIVEQYAAKDSRIKILKHDVNKRQGGARNTAMRVAQGKYIVCLDSDDWMEPNCLEIVNSEFKLRKTNSIWFNAKKYFEERGIFAKEPMYNQQDGYRTLTPDNVAAYSDFTWIKAYTRESIQKYNLGWPEGLTFEDGEFYFEYFTHNPKTYVISDCLINYRHREGSTVREADKGKIRLNDVFEVLRHLRVFWTELGVYEDYKRTMIKLIQNRVRMCLSHNYSEENRKLSYKFLKEIGYPEDFYYQNPERRKETPLVSVVVPFYNVEQYIAECLDSIINQTYTNLEIICVDDCGQDNSIKIVEDYAKKDNRIKIIKHERNKGLGGARNTGLKNATGEYIFFVDSDDWIESDCISVVTQKLIETGLNVVCFKAQYWLEWLKKTAPIKCRGYYIKLSEQSLTVTDENISMLPIETWSKAYKRKFLVENDFNWRENFPYEDVEFFYKVFTKSPYTYILDNFLYYYRQRSGSIMSTSFANENIAKKLYYVTFKLYEYYKKNNLLEKHKDSFLKYILGIFALYGNSPINNNLRETKLKFLKDINFPDEYKGIV